MNDDQPSPGQPIPPRAVLIELRVPELRQLFNAMDPSPFREKDLDRGIETFIVDWARDSPRHSSFALLVHVDRATALADDTIVLADAVRGYFEDRAASSRRELKRLFAAGRVSLAIGLAALVLALIMSEVVGGLFGQARFGGVLRESLLIGGWVAMWRPIEIFLYDWWPILANARLYDRLSEMPVRVALAPPPTDSGARSSRQTTTKRL